MKKEEAEKALESFFNETGEETVGVREILFHIQLCKIFRRIPSDFFWDQITKCTLKLDTKIKDLETQLAINEGVMRACQVALENAHDEVVKDFACFLIDRAKDGCIQINDLPDLVAEWSSPSIRQAELLKQVGKAFQEGVKPSPVLCEGSITGKSFYEARFQKVE